MYQIIPRIGIKMLLSPTDSMHFIGLSSAINVIEKPVHNSIEFFAGIKDQIPSSLEEIAKYIRRTLAFEVKPVVIQYRSGRQYTLESELYIAGHRCGVHFITRMSKPNLARVYFRSNVIAHHDVEIVWISVEGYLKRRLCTPVSWLQTKHRLSTHEPPVKIAEAFALETQRRNAENSIAQWENRWDVLISEPAAA